MTHLFKPVLILLFLFFVGSAHAGIVTFDTVTISGADDVLSNGHIHTEAGFNVKSNSSTYSNFLVRESVYGGIDGNTFAFGKMNSITITSIDGGAFDFNSISYGFGTDFISGSGQLRFYATKANSTYFNTTRNLPTSSIYVDDDTFGTDFMNLIQLRVVNMSPGFPAALVDNIDLSAASTVPLPAGLYLFLSGLAAIAGIKRIHI